MLAGLAISRLFFKSSKSVLLPKISVLAHNFCQMSNQTKNQGPSKGSCPMGYDQPDSKWNIENKHEYEVEDDTEAKKLSTQSMTSSIPRGNSEENWVYPSNRQFYNAMKRKGWDPKAEDAKNIVAVHNTINEQSWKLVMEYEKIHASECANPRLLRFRGRPRDLSPKARMMSFLGYKPPFDRHDWVVDRCGKEVIYIVDFYNGQSVNGLPSVYIDARPELTFEGALDRIRVAIQKFTS